MLEVAEGAQTTIVCLGGWFDYGQKFVGKIGFQGFFNLYDEFPVG